MIQALAGAASSPATGGGTSTLVQLIDADCTRGTGPATFRLNANGVAEKRTNVSFGTSYTTLYSWLVSGAVADYQCRATVTGGLLSSGDAVNTWLALTTTRAWISSDCTLTMEIRQISTSTVLDSCTVILLNLV